MKNTKIQWATHTFNPWIGCTHVSPGCDNCYAEASMDKRWKKVKWGRGQERIRTSESNWRHPLKWNEEAKQARILAEAAGSLRERPRVFCASLADWLDDEVPIEWLKDLLLLIAQCPEMDWLLLSKRLENFEDRVRSAFGILGLLHGPIQCRENIWIGTSIESQDVIGRLDLLANIPAAVRFISCEPLLGPIDLSAPGVLSTPTTRGIVEWVIAGGESGPNARPVEHSWITSLRDQCVFRGNLSGTPFFFKQWGKTRPDRFLDGVEWSQVPNQVEAK